MNVPNSNKKICFDRISYVQFLKFMNKNTIQSINHCYVKVKKYVNTQNKCIFFQMPAIGTLLWCKMKAF